MLRIVRLGFGVGFIAASVAIFGGCSGGSGVSGGTCSADNHTVLDAMGQVAATCTAAQACNVGPTGNAACATCDPTLCLMNNACTAGWNTLNETIKADPMTQTTQCRLTCKAHSDCPFNYHCVPGTGGGDYCVSDRNQYTPDNKGTSAATAPWGEPCDPEMGFDSNPDCQKGSAGDQFWCYGTSPTDANAFCTQYQCTDDNDCAGGWWCATINDTPSVAPGQTKRNDWGTTTTVCLPRTYNDKPGSYCAPCKTDLDCPLNAGVAQHCVSADNNGGSEHTCAAECTNDNNCPLDYQCSASDDAGGAMVCVPRAATCTGDGSFCSPCHSDTDCASGMGDCILADYSTEHFCTAKSGEACSVNGNMLVAMCPSTTGTPTNAGVSCSYNTQFAFPKDQCFGLVDVGTGSNAAQVGGCWTKHTN